MSVRTAAGQLSERVRVRQARCAMARLCLRAAALHLLLAAITAQQGEPSAKTDDVIDVFVVPHSHDDVGFHRTVDQYFEEQVVWIYDTVIQQLSENPQRKFIFVEMAFMRRWWERQNNQIKNQTRRLLHAGQLEIVNGGWSMADEADTTMRGQLNNFQAGHEFARRELGVRPHVGWHVR